MIQDLKNICAKDYPWNELGNKTVLITGATGFIGSFIVHVLMYRNNYFKENIKICAFGRNIKIAKERFNKYWNEENFEFVTHDLCLPIKYKKNIDYIFHCASNASPDKYITDPVGTMKVNLEGTINLLEFAKASGVKKVVYTSTIEVYGKTNGIDKIREDDFGYIDSMVLRSNYPISKKAAEMLCVAYANQYEIDVRIGRIPYSYGPGMRNDDKKVVIEFIRNVAHGKNIVLKSTGSQKRSYCYIADIVSALFTILFFGEKAEAYNISSDESIVSIADLATMLVNFFPEKNLQVEYDIPRGIEQKHFSFIGDAVLNSEKLQKLGWIPMYNLADGLKKCVLDEMG